MRFLDFFDLVLMTRFRIENNLCLGALLRPIFRMFSCKGVSRLRFIETPSNTTMIFI